MLSDLACPVLTNEQIVNQALDRINTGYVFPDKAAELDAVIRRRLAADEYAGLDEAALCAAVTAHFQEVCPDKHLRLLRTELPQDMGKEDDGDDEDAGRPEILDVLRTESHGIRRVENLEGNIGYIDLRRIATAAEGAAAIGAAMQLVALTSALVLDLRGCRGGFPDGAAMWNSYFFPDGEVHLHDIHHTPSGTVRQYWTAAHLPAPRYLDRPVHVLTGPDTFSGGEDVAYTLQAHGRAVLVGATTAGGAHPTDWYPLTPHVVVTVPTARTVSTVTGTNWEGVGVSPDVPVPADQALDAALKAIRESLDAAA